MKKTLDNPENDTPSCARDRTASADRVIARAPSVDPLPWFCVQTFPMVERRAMLALSEQGWRCHLPQFVQRQRRYGRTESVLRIFFPTYLFVSFDPDSDPWGMILRADQLVRRIFTSGPGRPMPLRTGEVERLMALGRAGDGAFDDEAPPVGVGDQVRVLDGAFREWTGICKWAAEDRIGVMLTLFSGDRVVKMPRSAVEIVSDLGVA